MGVRTGSPLNRTPGLPWPQPLSVELGPGILNNIFDGIQRPLKTIAVASGDCFIPRGVAVPALDPTKQWEFHPTTFKVRQHCMKPACSYWHLRPLYGPCARDTRMGPEMP